MSDFLARSAKLWSLRYERVTVHDDVIKWKHFPRYWPFVRGIHRSPVNSPHIGQWRGSLMFSLTSAWINGWRNSHKAGDLRRPLGHYDVRVMSVISECSPIQLLRPIKHNIAFSDILQCQWTSVANIQCLIYICHGNIEILKTTCNQMWTKHKTLE